MRLYDTARWVLNAVCSHYDTAGIELPKRRIVTPGRPAWDCPQVTVWSLLSQPVEANVMLPSVDPLSSMIAHRAAQLVLEIVRETPIPKSTTAPLIRPEVLEDNAKVLYGDLDHCIAAIRTAAEETDELVHSLAFGAWAIAYSGEPAGALVASQLQVTIGLL